MEDKVKERNKAGQALFQLQFMGMMSMCGRMDEADEAYRKAQEILIELEKELDE